MDKTAEDLKVRTKKFAIAILDFVDTLPRTPSGDAVALRISRTEVWLPAIGPLAPVVN